MRFSFRQFAFYAALAMGSPLTFGLAVAFVVIWGLAGPYYHFSDGWQLVANTVTTLLTFLVVFLVQATQNRDAKATCIKLDELLRAVEGARTGFVNLDALSDHELDRLETELRRLGRREGVHPVAADIPAGAPVPRSSGRGSKPRHPPSATTSPSATLNGGKRAGKR